MTLFLSWNTFKGVKKAQQKRNFIAKSVVTNNKKLMLPKPKTLFKIHFLIRIESNKVLASRPKGSRFDSPHCLLQFWLQLTCRVFVNITSECFSSLLLPFMFHFHWPFHSYVSPALDYAVWIGLRSMRLWVTRLSCCCPCLLYKVK